VLIVGSDPRPLSVQPRRRFSSGTNQPISSISTRRGRVQIHVVLRRKGTQPILGQLGPKLNGVSSVVFAVVKMS
jgi:hypothetical protein